MRCDLFGAIAHKPWTDMVCVQLRCGTDVDAIAYTNMYDGPENDSDAMNGTGLTGENTCSLSPKSAKRTIYVHATAGVVDSRCRKPDPRSDPRLVERIDGKMEIGGDGKVERDDVGVTVREQGKCKTKTRQETEQKREEKSAKKRNKIV